MSRQKSFSLALGMTFSVLLLAICWAASNGNRLPQPFAAIVDYDSLLRLVLVQQFMAGQSWYDLSIARVLPPEGFTSHWSRLVDVPLAFQLSVLQRFFDTTRAINLLMIVWPLQLGLIYVLVAYATARKLFGSHVAAWSLLGISLTLAYHVRIFPASELDHHNLQFLFLSFAVFALMAVDDPRRAGVLSGGASAFALAINPDASFVILLLGLTSLWFWITSRDQDTWTAPFLLSLGGFAPVFFVIQTPPATWGQMPCDKLAIPLLAITSAAAFVGLVLSSLDSRVTTRMNRTICAATASGLAILAALPLFGGCLSEPYGTLPETVYDIVLAEHPEVTSFVAYLATKPFAAISYGGPLILVLVFLVVLPVPEHASDTRQKRALLWVIILGSLVCSQLQMRILYFGYITYPIAFGLVMARLVAVMPKLGGFAPLMAVPIAVAVAWPGVISGAAFTTMMPKTEEENDQVKETCRRGDVVSRLATLPQGLILAPGSFGARILAYTDHQVVSLSSHSSLEGITNTTFDQRPDAEFLQAILDRHPVDYVLLCAEIEYEEDNVMGARILRGEIPENLRLMTQFQGLMVFQITR